MPCSGRPPRRSPSEGTGRGRRTSRISTDQASACGAEGGGAEEGEPFLTIGHRGGKPGEFNLPVDVAVARDGTLYVLDSGNFRVQAFDSGGRFLRAFGSVGAGPGQFSRPRGIGVDPDGNVYVSDAWFGNVQVFDPRGRLLLAIGRRERADGPGHYRLPAGIAVDETRRVYIVDQYFHKVEVVRRLGDAESRRIAERVATPR